MKNKNSRTFVDLSKNELDTLLAEYQAIEQMHMHYDVINMTITAIITAGVLALWGLVLQTAFQYEGLLADVDFNNSVGILAVMVFFVLSVWIRYLTLHRWIVLKKLNRSHEIEKKLKMKQNLIFEYSSKNLRSAIESDNAKSRPGGHTLEMVLYFSLVLLGNSLALIFQLHLRMEWNIINYAVLTSLAVTLALAVLLITSCKLVIASAMKGKIELGFPWNILLIIVLPISKFLRRFVNYKTRTI